MAEGSWEISLDLSNCSCSDSSMVELPSDSANFLRIKVSNEPLSYQDSSCIIRKTEYRSVDIKVLMQTSNIFCVFISYMRNYVYSLMCSD